MGFNINRFTTLIMQHKGEILEKAVRESGMPLTKLTKKLNKSRRWIYNAFENPNVSIDYILEIGKIIHHDFSEDIAELKKYRTMAAFMHLENVSETDNNEKQGQDYWKNKYLKLLEKYNQLLERGL
jgi:CRISPR/Cas system-associated exonuclease Cas4 (RecB family)